MFRQRYAPPMTRSGDTITVYDPSTGEAFAEVATATAGDVDQALAAATDEFESGGWRETNATERGRTLLRIAQLMRERAGDLIEAEMRNAGHPIGNARWEAATAADVFEFFAGAANKHYGHVIPVPDGGLDVALREPVGVCVAIVPWNFPLLISTWKIAPALAAGNPVILKPASLTPLSALVLEEIIHEAGVPEAAFTVLPGPGSVVGDALVRDPRTSKISFTGETATGSRILRSSADNITRVSLELGGKSPCVVFDDADLGAAAAAAPMSVFDNTGQDCCARSRFLVQRSAHDQFVEAFIEATDALVVGAPGDEGTDLGPMISEAQRTTARSYVDIGIAEGAERVAGGSTVDGPGWYMTPTILAGVDNDMRVAQEEIFGPVAVVIPFDDEAHAVELANASPYGLSGSLWTRDLGRAIRVSKRIRTGVLSVNSARSVRTEAPFGGFKQSGLGRELGMAAMDHYTEVKNVFYNDV
jgi:acyl-CoA reductase-like NAD-dependent aldehyde dehydrogenase